MKLDRFHLLKLKKIRHSTQNTKNNKIRGKRNKGMSEKKLGKHDLIA